MNIELRKITVPEAQALLEGHENRRPLSEKMINEMTADIEAGTYDPKDCYVCLNADGTLFYGQHILNAIIRLGRDDVEVNVARLSEEDSGHHIGTLNAYSKYRYHIKRDPAEFFKGKTVVCPPKRKELKFKHKHHK